MTQANTNINQQTQEEPDYHEVEFLETFEVDEETALHDRKKNCKKDPEHSGFIPVEKFNIEHLPEGDRDPLFLEYILVLISLTVRLVVRYVSYGRPEYNYKFYQYRGKHIPTFGSGRVWSVVKKFTDMDGESCPCTQCEKRDDKDRKKQWGEFKVITAKHVVFDSEESRHTQVDVDYNTDTDRDTCPKLHGVEVRDSDMEKDECQMYVVSHDRDVCLVLEERVRRHKNLHDKLENKYREYSESNNLDLPIVCVSHPHGMSKHVSVGKFSGRQEDRPCKWRYTTSTCPGSSGAPVYRLGRIEGRRGFPKQTIGYNRGFGYITQHRGYNRGIGSTTHHSGYNRSLDDNESGWLGYSWW